MVEKNDKVTPIHYSGKKSLSKRSTLAFEFIKNTYEASSSNKPKQIINKEKNPFNTLESILYRLDLFVSTRSGQSICLVIFGVILCFVGGLVYYIIKGDITAKESLWNGWLFLSDPGSQDKATNTLERIYVLINSICGILFFSVVMGVIVDGIREKMDNLRKGKSKVAEENHSLLLGWTDKSISLIKEICIANESMHGGVIVVLAEEEKEILEAELRSQIKPNEFLSTQVVFRVGTPLLSVDLMKVSATTAKSIVIMADKPEADKSDASTLRTILSIRSLPKIRGHIVAEVRDIDNEALVRLVGGDEVETIVSHDVIGRLVIMAARSLGLAKVYNSVLGFEGNEFYLKEWPECVGIPFGSLAERFPDAIPIGIQEAGGKLHIKPNFKRLVRINEKILFLAEDDDSYVPKPPLMIEPGSLPQLPAQIRHVERILLCGWRRDIRDMITLLDSLVLFGTEVHMVCEQPLNLRSQLLQENGLDVNSLKNIKLVHYQGNTAVRRHMEALPWDTYTSIMILADQEREGDVMHSDSHSLASLLLIRDLQSKKKVTTRETLFSMGIAQKIHGWNKAKEEKCGYISEILDPRTQKTIQGNAVALNSEFVQSNELISRILAMISENRAVKVILDELLGAKGCSFAVEPSRRYVKKGEKASFWQIAKRALLYDEILCGYQRHDSLSETVLNPKDKSEIKDWDDYDMVVLVGEPLVQDKDILENHKKVIEAFEDGAKRRRAKILASVRAKQSDFTNSFYDLLQSDEEIEDSLDTSLTNKRTLSAGSLQEMKHKNKNKNNIRKPNSIILKEDNENAISSFNDFNDITNLSQEQKEGIKNLAYGLLAILERQPNKVADKKNLNYNPKIVKRSKSNDNLIESLLDPGIINTYVENSIKQNSDIIENKKFNKEVQSITGIKNIQNDAPTRPSPRIWNNTNKVLAVNDTDNIVEKIDTNNVKQEEIDHFTKENTQTSLIDLEK